MDANKKFQIIRRRAQRRQICLTVLLAIFEMMSRKSRKYWVRPFLEKRKERGDYHVAVPDMLKDDPEYFFEIFRFTPSAFRDLLRLVGPQLKKKYMVREPIGEEERLLMTLEVLASGNMQKSVAKNYRVGRSTFCNIVRETCQAIYNVLRIKVLAIPTTEDFLRIAADFRELWQFPACCGAINGKHFAIPKPPNSGTTYYNYKGFFSLVLLASCDAKYNFTTFNIGAAGSESDGGIFRRSQLGQKLLTSTLNLPPPCRLLQSKTVLPSVFLGDEAFPLLPHLMRPFPGENLSIEEQVYNYRLSRARRVIENTFGILVARWRVTLDTMHMLPDNAEIVIKACIVLHNYLRRDQSTKSLYVPKGFVDYEDPNTGQL